MPLEVCAPAVAGLLIGRQELREARSPASHCKLSHPPSYYLPTYKARPLLLKTSTGWVIRGKARVGVMWEGNFLFSLPFCLPFHNNNKAFLRPAGPPLFPRCFSSRSLSASGAYFHCPLTTHQKYPLPPAEVSVACLLRHIVKVVRPDRKIEVVSIQN